jgi:hypothetical protein
MTRFPTLAALAVVVPLLSAAAAAAADATLFRIYLADGTTMVSFGEYARVNDQVIFSMPAGGSADQPRLHVVTLNASLVDWTRTDAYATSARYQQYASTRGDEDFQLLSNEVARVLNDIALTTDRERALATAEQARRSLADWPRAHYGYRQDEVREIIGLIDESIARLKGVRSPNEFQLALVTSTPQLPLEPLAGMPTPREQLEQIFRLTQVTDRASDRVALLQSAIAILSDAPTGLSFVETEAYRRAAQRQITQEVAIDTQYAEVSKRLTAAAARGAARGRVADVQRVLDRIPREDVRLGAHRPEAIQSLRQTVEAHLEAARRVRLLHDQWQIRRSLYRDYERMMQAQMLQLVKAQPALEAIRKLEGPTPERLTALRSRLSGGAERLQRQPMPDDLRAPFDLLVNAWRFAEHAVDRRYSAISSGNVGTAWEASSAAAGALMLLSRAQQEIRTLIDPPRIP